ncbi:hypothetical protein [Corynebacterium glutamicum]|uniref:hypothetical protein n=1 Tax=Corynebacterium glutamicum TaxID=1718 RepID=UPI00117D6696|nr:hypothetical protein [Corynebacterium glutamicum]QDQ19958.1 hypothetical protein FOL53_03675 [Corynebacterium glutamicum]QDQ23525.1 hypothetical protein FOY32_08305 [Corynebacterium glutamicum]
MREQLNQTVSKTNEHKLKKLGSATLPIFYAGAFSEKVVMDRKIRHQTPTSAGSGPLHFPYTQHNL